MKLLLAIITEFRVSITGAYKLRLFWNWAWLLRFDSTDTFFTETQDTVHIRRIGNLYSEVFVLLFRSFLDLVFGWQDCTCSQSLQHPTPHIPSFRTRASESTRSTLQLLCARCQLAFSGKLRAHFIRLNVYDICIGTRDHERWMAQGNCHCSARIQRLVEDNRCSRRLGRERSPGKSAFECQEVCPTARN